MCEIPTFSSGELLLSKINWIHHLSVLVSSQIALLAKANTAESVPYGPSNVYVRHFMHFEVLIYGRFFTSLHASNPKTKQNTRYEGQPATMSKAALVVPALKRHTSTVIVAHGLGDR